ncbi:MAG: tetratricopeptide repeat protein [Planctomycetota bacterium]
MPIARAAQEEKASLPAAVLVLATFLVPILFSSRTFYADAVKTLVYECAAMPALFFWLAGAMARGRLALPPRRLIVAIFLFWGVNLASYFWSAFPLTSGAELWRISVLLFLALLAAAHMTAPKDRGRLGYAVALGSLFVAGYGMAQWLGLDPIQWKTGTTNTPVSMSRIFSSLGNPNMLAAYCVGVLPLLWFGVLRARDPVLRGLSAAAGGAIFLCLFLTQSRGGFLGLAASALFLVAYNRRTLLAFFRRRWILALLLGLVLLGATACVARPMLRRFAAMLKPVPQRKGLVDLRILIWEGAVKNFAQHPVFGTGIGTFKTYFPRYRDPDFQKYELPNRTLHAHSEYLEVLSDMGMIGLLAFGFLLWAFFARGVSALRGRDPDRRMEAQAVLASLIGILAHNLLCVNMRWPANAYLVWLLLGWLSALSDDPLPWIVMLPPGLRNVPVRAALSVALAVGIGVLVYRCTIQPFQAELYFVRGKILSERERPEAALRALREAVRLHPNQELAWYYIGHCLIQEKRYPEAEAAYRFLMELSPDFVQVHYNLAGILVAEGRWAEAIEEFLKQRRLGGLPVGADFTALFPNANGGQGIAVEALIAAMKRVLAKDPENAMANHCLGCLYFEKGAYPEALGYAQKALALDGKNLPAINNLAGVYFGMKRYTEAAIACRRALGIDPDYVVAWINLGRIHLARDNRAGAREAWTQALALEPENEEARNLLTLVPPAP